MIKNGKAGTVATVTDFENQKIALSNQKAFSTDDYRKKRSFGQCVRCLSDYMKFSLDGFCQDCQQRVEFILREHPQVLKKAQNKGGN